MHTQRFLADVISRYKKIIGYDTFFITGMDEHGQKIETIAKKNSINITPAALDLMLIKI